MLKPEADRMRNLLVDAITTLCRSGLRYNSELKVEGLIGITLDENDIILVNVNKIFEVPFKSVSTPQRDNRQSDAESDIVSERTPQKSKARERLQYDQSDSSQASPARETPSKRRSTISQSSPSVPKRRKSDSSSGDQRGRDSQADIHIENAFSLTAGSPTIGATSPRDTNVSHTTASSSKSSDSQRPSRPSSQQEASSSVSKDKPVVKIEIDSDSDVETVKTETIIPEGVLPQSAGTLQTDVMPQNVFSQTGFPSGAALGAGDMQGELYASQLPPELASITGLPTDSTSNVNAPVPVGMFSSNLVQPMPGPSGLNLPSHTAGAPYMSQQIPGASSMQSPGFGTKAKNTGTIPASPYGVHTAVSQILETPEEVKKRRQRINSKHYRQRLKQDPLKYQKYKAKQCERMKQYRERNARELYMYMVETQSQTQSQTHSLETQSQAVEEGS